MANIKAGLVVAVGTVIVVMLELLLYPIALGFMTNLNNSPWVSSTDRTILNNVPTMFIVGVLFTVLGGAVASIYTVVKG